MGVIRFLVRAWITPLLIAICIFTTYQLGLLVNQTAYIIVLLVSGISGQLIQIKLESKKKKEAVDSQAVHEEKEKKDPLAKLPKEIQELIKEGEAMNNNDEKKG